MLFQRACQVVLWSIPAMSVYAMKKGASNAARGKPSQLERGRRGSAGLASFANARQ
jgi:hypothetical protein